MRLFVSALFASAVALPALAATEVPAGITARETPAGVYFANDKGMALYTYAQDKPGKSVCNNDCAKAWPPVVAPADAKNQGEWSVIKRDDGSLQWALHEKPVYTYVRDTYPGGALGDRVGNAWNVAFDPILMPPGINVRATYVGRILVDGRGLTLYARSDEKPGGKPACVEKCVHTWTPLFAPIMANTVGDFTPVKREDGSLQWAYKGQRLYLNTNDFKPAQTSGDGVDKVWRAVVLDPAPPLPSWVTVQRADMGEIFANEKGLALYTVSGSLEKVKQLMCDDACIAKYWDWVPAAADAKPTGEWTIVKQGDNMRWAYKGNVVYTHKRDKVPGAVGGDKFAAGVGGVGGTWSPIQRKRDYEEQ
jgi:predicted lipoprotein with Yx(FWY)xxD motif